MKKYVDDSLKVSITVFFMYFMCKHLYTFVKRRYFNRGKRPKHLFQRSASKLTYPWYLQEEFDRQEEEERRRHEEERRRQEEERRRRQGERRIRRREEEEEERRAYCWKCNLVW